MENVAFYREWLPLNKKEFRILAMLADFGGEYHGNLTDILLLLCPVSTVFASVFAKFLIDLFHAFSNNPYLLGNFLRFHCFGSCENSISFCFHWIAVSITHTLNILSFSANRNSFRFKVV